MSSRVLRSGRVALAVVGLLAALVVATDPSTAAPACAKQTLPTSIARRPVVLVHGWNGGPGSWDKTVAAMTAKPYKSNDSFRFLRYDYAERSADWPNVHEVSGCLAEFLVRVSRLWKAGGGDGQVLAVAHSMGGIALRFAAAQSFDGTKAGDILGGVVTLGTPHTGSPWGGTWTAALLQYKATQYDLSELIPPMGSNAEICLHTQESRDPLCTQPPLFPARVPLTTIGTQISINRDVFGFDLATFQLFGDGIVPADSSTGYPRSGPTKAGGGREAMPRGTELRTVIEPCEYDSSGMLGTNIWADLLQLGVDDHASEALLRGDAGVPLLAVTAAALGKPCFHSGLASEARVVGDTYLALSRYAKALDKKAAKPDLAEQVVGDWDHHGATLTITSLTSGHERWTLGYGGCDNDDARCFVDIDLAFTVRGQALEAKVTSVTVTDEDNQIIPSRYAAPWAVGDTFTLRFAHPNLLSQFDHGYGPTYWCNDKTPDPYTNEQNLCGI